MSSSHYGNAPLEVVDGQHQYGLVHYDSVLSIPPSEGVQFPERPWYGRVRPYRIDDGQILAVDQGGQRVSVPMPMELGDQFTYHGMSRPDRVLAGLTRAVISFRHYKTQPGTDHREPHMRVVLADRIGHGVLHPGHIGERPTFYMRATHVANCAVGEEIDPKDIPNNIGWGQLRHFSIVRMGLLGDPNDPDAGAALRAYWGIDYIPEPQQP